MYSRSAQHLRRRNFSPHSKQKSFKMSTNCLKSAIWKKSSFLIIFAVIRKIISFSNLGVTRIL